LLELVVDVVHVVVAAHILVRQSGIPLAQVPVQRSIVSPAEDRAIIAIHADVLHVLAAAFVLVLILLHPGAIKGEREVAVLAAWQSPVQARSTPEVCISPRLSNVATT
jgi:hypothetical protein